MSQKRKKKELKRNKRKKNMVKRSIEIDTRASRLDVDDLLHWKTNILQKSKIQDGYDIERIVESLCHRIGLPDIVIKSPMYTETSGVEKEICDLMVVCNEVLIVFQVKHRVLDTNKAEDVVVGRAQKTIEKLEYQFSTFVHLYENDRLPLLKTNKGLEVQLQKENFQKVIFVGVVAYPGTENLKGEKSFEIINGFKIFKGYPLHLFDIDEFDKISLELDTPKDLKVYLNVRERYFGESNIGLSSELNLLAYYKMNPKQLLEAMNEGARIAIDENMWNHFIEKFGDKIVDRNKSNGASYIYDLMLSKVFEAVGFEVPDIDIEYDNDPGSVDGYFQLIKELSDFGRVFRRSLGEAIKATILRADENMASKGFGYAYRLIIDGDNKKRAIIFLAVVDGFMNRSERCKFLYNLSMTAQYKFGLEKIVCVATESQSCSQRSFDFMAMGDNHFLPEQDEGFVNGANQLWRSEPQYINEFEFSK